MTQKQQPPEQKPATETTQKPAEEDEDLLDMEDIRGASEKKLKQWRQVGQTGGE